MLIKQIWQSCRYGSEMTYTCLLNTKIVNYATFCDRKNLCIIGCDFIYFWVSFPFDMCVAKQIYFINSIFSRPLIYTKKTDNTSLYQLSFHNVRYELRDCAIKQLNKRGLGCMTRSPCGVTYRFYWICYDIVKGRKMTSTSVSY